MQAGQALYALESEQTEAERIAAMRVVNDGLYTIESVDKPGNALDVDDSSTKAGASVLPSKRKASIRSQKWIVLQDGKTGYYRIRNLNSRLFLSVAGKAKGNAAFKQAKSSASKTQLWEIVQGEAGIIVKSAAHPKLALTFVKGKGGTTKILLKKVNRKLAQQCRLRKANPIEDGRSYFIRSALSPKQGLAIGENYKKTGAKYLLAKRSSAKTQKFRVKKTGASYSMQCVKSCKYVSAAKGSLKQAANAKGKASKWSFVLDLNTATYAIKSTSADSYVDASNGSLSLKKLSEDAPGEAQRFILVSTYGFTVFLDAGHGRNSSGWGVYDPGAEGCGYEEADLTKDLAKRIETKLEGSDVRVFNGTQYSVPYWQRNGKARSLGCDIVLSIHFNADGGSSTATMLGSRSSAASSKFNTIIHKRLVKSTGLPDGGTMHRGDITVVNGSVPAVLMEVCFIDNYGSLHRYLNRRDAVATSLAEGVVAASKQPALQR